MPRTVGSGGQEQYSPWSLVEGDIVDGGSIQGRVGTYRKEERGVISRKVEEIEAAIERIELTLTPLEMAIENNKTDELRLIGKNLLQERKIIFDRVNSIAPFAPIELSTIDELNSILENLTTIARELIEGKTIDMSVSLDMTVANLRDWFQQIAILKGEEPSP